MLSAIPSSFGRRWIRYAAGALLVPGLLAPGSPAVATSPAAAEGEPVRPGGAEAVLGGLQTYDTVLLHVDGEDESLLAGLFEMTVEGGGTLKTYGVDVRTPSREGARYQETSWDQTSLGGNKNAGRIGWILQHSYPQIDDLTELAHKAGTGPLTEQSAAAGTQVAVWRISNGADVEAVDAQAEKLADWLQRSAKDTTEPRASLDVEPAAVSGRAGGRIGPVTVRTGAAHVTVTAQSGASVGGVGITGKDGTPVTTATDGTRLWFDVPADAPGGTATLGLQATTSVPVGRAFGATALSQTQIVAGSSESTVAAEATADWADQGVIPAFTAENNCARGGVDVVATNEGDQPFTFELAGGPHTVTPDASRTVTVPVDEDRTYAFALTGPDGFRKSFNGVLDCRTAGTPGPVTEPATAEPVPASAGDAPLPGTEDLAATGSSDTTPLAMVIAIALIMIGAAAIRLSGRKKSAGRG